MSETYRAISSFVTKVDGKKRTVRKGAVVDADDPLIREDGRPELFVQANASDDTERAALVRLTSQPTCLTCRRRFPRENPTGRPPSFCGRKCRKEREKALERAQKGIARGHVPTKLDDIEQALADCGLLREAWSGRKDVPLPLQPPTSRARSLLSRHMAALQRAHRQAAEDERKKREGEAKEARRKKWKEARKADEDAEREARKALADAATSIPDDEETS